MQQPFGFLDTLQHLAEQDDEDKTDAENDEIDQENPKNKQTAAAVNQAFKSDAVK